MFTLNIDKEFIIYIGSVSEGTQVKYKKDNIWYKCNRYDNDGLVEYLVSNILRFSSLSSDEYVLYDMGYINGIPGCSSVNFLKEPEDSLITFQRLYSNVTGRDLSEVVNNYNTIEERFSYVINFFKKNLDYDISNYLKKIFTLDFLSLNIDRHFNNLGLIYHKNGSISDAPIFDNGMSLLNGNVSYNKNFSIAENVKRVVARPFSGSHKKMLDYIGLGFKLDVPKALCWVKQQLPSFPRDVLIYQLETNKDLFR